MIAPGPKYTIQANQPQDGVHERNASWCCAFVRFAEPASSYAANVSLTQTKPILVVENDCVGVDINRPKDSFAKTATLTMKVSNVYYANAVSPGDWVMIWMSDYQTDIDRIVNMLYGKDTSGRLIDWYSGLKFTGRVIEVGDVDTVVAGGTRTLQQTISCQMFLEFATSVYYTYLSKSIINPTLASPSGQLDSQVQGATKVTNQEFAQTAGDQQIQSFLKGKVMDSFFANFLQKLTFYPDNCVAYNFIMTMGVPASDNFVNQQAGIVGELSDAITIPRDLAGIHGLPQVNRLWQIYNVYLGIQQYSAGPGNPWAKFMPQYQNADSVFKPSQYRCKGFVPYYPMQWDNQSLWEIMGQYLNPVVNEIYTALRVNDQNQILPTLIVREKPLGTGLYNYLQLGQIGQVTTVPDGQDQSQSSAVQSAQKQLDPQATTITVQPQAGQTGAGYLEQSTVRGMFHNLPRWNIDDSMIKQVNTRTQESNRVNFVQVWGRASGAEYLKVSNDLVNQIKLSGFIQGNYCADPQDITRNGLRADIKESVFDVVSSSTDSSGNQIGTLASSWARMRADWLFNGHLKLQGSISCYGVQEPICEGDNCEVRGVVYHIEGLSFTGRINTATGKKEFDTVIQVSNGLLSKGLDGTRAPLYSCHRPEQPWQPDNQGPGYTEVQAIHGRSSSGEAPAGPANSGSSNGTVSS